MLESLRAWAFSIRRDVVALWLGARDPRVPLPAKIVAGMVAAYALSPIDLIPDFIPVLGYLDDLLIVPLGIMLAIRLIPPVVLVDLRAEAMRITGRPRSRAGATAIIVVWVVCATAILWLLWLRRAA